MKLRCYCCGEQLGKRFVLVSYSERTDRVFVFKPEHVQKIDETAFTQKVRTP